MRLIINLLINSLTVFICAQILPGIKVKNFGSSIWVAIVLGLVNIFIRPLFIILTLPITILTLGIFALFINTIMILLVSKFVPSFRINGFWWAFLLSIILSFVSTFLHTV